MSIIPPDAVIEAYYAPVVRKDRRVEIYESDGSTMWLKNGVPATYRLIDGNVNVDYTRDERRTIDCTLDNYDGFLDQDAAGGFWFDKILKVFLGIHVNQKDRPPRILIIEDNLSAKAADLRFCLTGIGFTDVRVNPMVTTIAELDGYEIIVSLANNSFTTKGALIEAAFAQGYSVFTVGNRNTGTQFPSMIDGTISKATTTNYEMVNDFSISNILGTGWSDFTQSNASGGTYITDIDAGATAISTVLLDGDVVITAAYAENNAGGKWVHLHDPGFGNSFNGSIPFIQSAFRYLNPYIPLQYWECQVGEFMIDGISEDNFPSVVKVTGRDYTKKLIGAKFAATTTFVAGDPPELLLKTIAINGGIDPLKVNIPDTGATVATDLTFDIGSSRWDAIKSIAEAFALEVYFDAYGYFTVRAFLDPVSSPISHEFKSATADADIVTFTKSTTDSDLYNHILVTGDSSDSTTVPVSAEAINTEPSSPTNVARIGDRLFQYTSSIITETAQAQAVADSFLAVYAMEDFDFSFTSISLPWLEVGEIARVTEPDPNAGDPDRYLLVSLDLPFALGPMSGDSKRVTVVG